MWLLNQCVKVSRDPKSMESYETFLSGKNVLKLFDLFWSKQVKNILDFDCFISHNKHVEFFFSTVITSLTLIVLDNIIEFSEVTGELE